MLKAVIFDKDGTLINSEPLHLRIWVDVLKERGYAATDAMLKECIGLNYKSMDKLLKGYFGENFGISEHYKYVNERVKEYELENGIELKKGFYELSDYLMSKGVLTAIATSSLHSEAQFCIDHLGISDRFNGIVGGDEIINGKPAPDIFLKAASMVNCIPNECLVFEDSANGVKAALAAGMKCIYIPDMKEIDEELQLQTTKLCSLDKAIPIIDDMIKACEF